MAKAADNPILEMLADSMLEVASQVITELHPSLEVLRHVVRRHLAVFEAIKSKDGDLAFSLMSQHIVDVQRRLAPPSNGSRRKARSIASK